MQRIRRRTDAKARAARVAWDRASDVWEEFQESGLDFSRERVHGPALVRAIGSVRGRRVLDLGCGQGRFTRVLARRGGRISGVDWSGRMIASARRHERTTPLGIDYRRQDARAVERLWRAGTFDVAVACMSFMDMPDLPRVLRATFRLLRPDGRLVFSVSHPLNTAGTRSEGTPSSGHLGFRVDRYFDEGVRRTRWEMTRLQRPFTTPYWHRTFETWFRLLTEAGFQVDSVAEPRASAAQVRKNPLLRGSRDAPFFLVIGCRKRAKGPR